MNKVWISVCLATAVVAPGLAEEKYEATFESLAMHNAEPEWLKDAKLGIYFHWGVYSVPAFHDEWYPRNMHLEGSEDYKHHQETYGDPSKFGYHDFVPMFKAEHFDPEEWADLFQQAGARFAGPVAEHHDGFSMWASKATPWNAKDMGPHRDVLGELFQSLEKRDMKTIATFHHSRNLQRYHDTWDEEMKKKGNKFRNSHYPYKPGWPTASDDPKLRMLYGNMPEAEWLDSIWLTKLEEVIDNYKPDIIWFDSWFDQVPEDYRAKFAAYYLNAAEKWNKDVVIVRKQQDLPLTFSINDQEKSREPKALPQLWMTDDTISTGSWCYTEDLKIKPVYKVIHALIDTVSKNGVMLLNISPKADGTIPDVQRKSLLAIGAWLELNGEAIYETRPWIEAAEGPTAEPGGGYEDHKKFLTLEYTAKDVRYTASKDGQTVYAITMGVPAQEEAILLKTFTEENVEVATVSLLNGDKVQWKMTDAGLEIEQAKAPEDAMAVIFKISLKKPLKPNPL
jgi:alpha-L-fucosidase